MLPRARGTHPKPRSAYKNWAEVARIQERAGLPKLNPTQLARFVKELTLEHKGKHGFDALLERRKEPLRDAEHQHLLALRTTADLARSRTNASPASALPGALCWRS